MLNLIFSFWFSTFVNLTHLQGTKNEAHTIVAHEISLQNRYNNSYVNNVFKHNILLATRYATGEKIDPANIKWEKIEKPFQSQLVLKPGETFAFHDDVLPQYEGKVDKTTSAHFNSSEGFRSDGYLVGNGVCHLASLLYWVAQDAGLSALAPTRHDFAPVPDVPSQFGVSIYNYPGKNTSNELQNLYISNTKNRTIAFVFNYDGSKLTIRAVD